MSKFKSNNTDVVGIDVSKDKLDVYFLKTGRTAIYGNNSKGMHKLYSALKSNEFKGLIALEPTGGYERPCMTYLSKKGLLIHVADPTKVHHFIKQKMS